MDFANIAACFKKINEFAGRNLVWMPLGIESKKLMDTLSKYDDINMLSIPEIKAFVSQNFELLNKELTDAGFDIQLTPSDEPDWLGFVAISDYKLTWCVEEDNSNFYKCNQSIASFDLKCGMNGIQFYELVLRSDMPVIAIQVDNGDTILIHEHIVNDELDLSDLVSSMVYSYKNTSSRAGVDTLRLPKINMKRKVDISCLQGMMESEMEYQIVEALHEVWLRMNQFGARAKSATAMCTWRSTSFSQPTVYTVENSFAFVVLRPGYDEAIYTTYVDEKYFADPGDDIFTGN
jgi:hypothetical protein